MDSSVCLALQRRLYVMHNYRIHINGMVQGVGFRPFVYRLACQIGISGLVRNNNEGVFIEMAATRRQKDLLLQRVNEEHPAAASILQIEVNEQPLTRNYHSFTISPSESRSSEITGISPDIAVCPECLKDLEKDGIRHKYPFINCTHCGPRFTIIGDLPYDRPRTTMSAFEMCDSCYSEYIDVNNRRFHAQPVACNTCGPYYYIRQRSENEENGTTLCDTAPHIIGKTCDILNKGNVIAMKGLGGYNLVCDAFNEKALEELRKIKKRDGKPFAVMFRSIEKLTEWCKLSETEETAICGWRKPIVLLELKKKLSPLINGGLKTLGGMLPYLPVHYLMFEQLNTDALVVTSGNLKDEPIITENEKAEQKLLPLTGTVLHHTRDIYNRADDSVVQCVGNRIQLIRRSRGYTPQAFTSTIYTDGILAFGAEKVNTFALGKNKEIILSQYIGDLTNKETHDFYKEAMVHFSKLYRFKPSLLVCDMHPDYFSTRSAEQLSHNLSLPLYKVQHHHAHAVACMEENRVTENCLAIILDGTGYGTDGHIWGGEFLICNHRDFLREAHFDYIPLPGGDLAVKQPWRTALSFLDHYGISLPTQWQERRGHGEIELVRKMISQNINSPLSCGAGRLFDAVSSLLGLCDVMNFQAEAPVRLEHAADMSFTGRYDIRENNPLDFAPMFESIVSDLSAGNETSRIAAKFHNTLAVALTKQTLRISQIHGLTHKIVLSGGCFQNRTLLLMLRHQLKQNGFEVFIPTDYPCNDGGISLGQMAIAATLRKSEYA